jgi:lipopolysaccharide heptosyltransferase I
LANSELISRPFQRILLIKLSALGDVIHTVPVLAKLRQRYPQARIDWLLTPGIAEWIGHHPALSNVLLFDRKGLARPWSAGLHQLRFLNQLRAGNYDLVVDLHGQFRSAIFTTLTGAPVRIGFDRPRSRNFHSPRNLPRQAYKHGWTGAREFSWMAYTHHIQLPTLEMHAVDRYLLLGEMLGLPPGPPDFHVPIPNYAVARVDDLLQRHGAATQKLIVLSPGSIWPTKRWRVDGFAEVARHFLEQGFAAVLTGATGDREVCAAVAAACPGAINLCAQTSVSELAELTRRADLCISNDSGPLHLAIAVDRPVVSIWGPTDPLWIGPYGHPDWALSLNLPCSPCYLRSIRQCPFDHKCMREMSAKSVIERAEEILSAAAVQK